MLVFNIQHFSTHDGPGIRTVIFLKGCPLDCAWCHNPEGKGFAPELSFDSARCIGCGKCEKICPVGCITMKTASISTSAGSGSAAI